MKASEIRELSPEDIDRKVAEARQAFAGVDDAALDALLRDGADACGRQDEACEYTCTRPDGSSFHAQLRASRVAGPLPFIAVALHDATPPRESTVMRAGSTR